MNTLFHIHDWSKWSKPIDTMSDYKKVQARCCNTCGKVQVQKIEQPFNLWFTAATLIDALKGES